MSNKVPYLPVGCKNLGMAIVADAIRSILNDEEDSKSAERFLLTSPISELCLAKIGVVPSDIPIVLEKLKDEGFKMWGRGHLSDSESYQAHKDNMSEARKNRRPETKKRQWRKHVYRVETEIF